MSNGRLDRCECGGFLPKGADRCPLCTKPALSRLVWGAVALVGGTGLALTLSACYGAPCSSCHRTAPPPPQGTSQCSDSALDTDRDGACGDQDCDEGDPNVQNCPEYSGAL